MPSNNLIIGVIGMGGLGIGSLISGYLWINSKPKFTVKSLASEDTKRTIVESEQDWEKIWESYKEENKGKPKGGDSWLVNEWNGDGSPTKIPFSYKDRCEAFGRYKVEDKNNDFYRHFIERCTIAKKV